MTIRFQRLLILLLSLIFLTISILLILYNSKKNLVFFYTPSELLVSNVKINDNVRIGGFIKLNSIINNSKNQYNFIIEDDKNFLRVNYVGLLPDLFREGQGAVIEGVLLKKNIIKAKTVFAKHDENYMPISIKKELESQNYWKKEYK